MNKPSLYVRFRNFFHPGFSCCSKCGGNWGWKKYKSHYTGGTGGLFLFCEECDKIVTVEERWEALDQWKLTAIEVLEVLIEGVPLLDLSPEEKQSEIERIKNTEFVEFPR